MARKSESTDLSALPRKPSSSKHKVHHRGDKPQPGRANAYITPEETLTSDARSNARNKVYVHDKDFVFPESDGARFAPHQSRLYSIPESTHRQGESEKKYCDRKVPAIKRLVCEHCGLSEEHSHSAMQAANMESNSHSPNGSYSASIEDEIESPRRKTSKLRSGDHNRDQTHDTGRSHYHDSRDLSSNSRLGSEERSWSPHYIDGETDRHQNGRQHPHFQQGHTNHHNHNHNHQHHPHNAESHNDWDTVNDTVEHDSNNRRHSSKKKVVHGDTEMDTMNHLYNAKTARYGRSISDGGQTGHPGSRVSRSVHLKTEGRTMDYDNNNRVSKHRSFHDRPLPNAPEYKPTGSSDQCLKNGRAHHSSKKSDHSASTRKTDHSASTAEDDDEVFGDAYLGKDRIKSSHKRANGRVSHKRHSSTEKRDSMDSHKSDRKSSKSSMDSKRHINGKTVETGFTQNNGHANMTGGKQNNGHANMTGVKQIPVTFESRTDLLASKLKKKKCVLVCVTIFVLLFIAGVAVALIALFVFPSGGTILSGNSTEGGYDMLRAHVNLKVGNIQFEDEMSDVHSQAFRNMSLTYCDQMSVRFLSSRVKDDYYGCTLISLRKGSVHITFTMPFQDTPYTSDIPFLNSTIITNSVRDTGMFVIQPATVHIYLESYKVTRLPQRPHFPESMSSTTLKNGVKHGKLVGAVGKEAQNGISPRPGATSGAGGETLGQSESGTKSSSTKANTLSSVNSNDSDKRDNRRIPGKQNDRGTENSQATQSMSQSTRNTNIDPSETVTDQWKQLSHSTDISHTTASPLPNNRNENPNTENAHSLDKSEINRNVYNQTNGGQGHPITSIIGKRKDNGISVSNAEVYLGIQGATIECNISTTRSIHNLTIYHLGVTRVPHKVLDITSKDLRNGGSRQLSRTLGIYIRKFDNSIIIGLNFTQAQCTDTGEYICTAYTPGMEISAMGFLNGTSLPGKPQLVLPTAFVEGREIDRPITCTADVGFPAGRIEYLIKPKGMPSFIPLGQQIVSTSGPCSNYVTSSMFYTPTNDGNGTLLQCVVVNGHVSSVADLTAVAEIRILPANLCNGKEYNQTLRHPFTCSKYIRCQGDVFNIEVCPQELCFDEVSGQCGRTALTMTSVVAYLNEGVTSLTCRLVHTGTWRNLTISKVYTSGYKERIVTAASGSRTPTIYKTVMKGRIFSNVEITAKYEVQVNLWVYVLTCADEGRYECDVDAPFELSPATGTIALRVVPEAPKITIPNEIIENSSVRTPFTCTAIVGYPHGHLVWRMKMTNETEYRPLIYEETREMETSNCSRLVTSTFTFMPTLSHNGMDLMCEVENTETLPVGHTLVDMTTIHVIPSDFCLRNRGTVPKVHPYDCHQYVQCTDTYTYVQKCGSSLCFNPDTLMCDSPVAVETETKVDPNHPCVPNKNGVFFPHPFLCNKYIWCVMGEEIIHHCPMGTLYIDGGQCTFEPDLSRCYKIPTT